MKIAALVQARMGSTRLPAKVMLDVEGKPMLWRVVDRLRRSKYLNQIIIVTTHNATDDAIEAFCKQQKIDFFRGNEEDVLDRYYQAATYFKVGQIVRITADCPLIDPEVVDAVIQKHMNSGADYTSNTLKRTYSRGLDAEVFSYDAMVCAVRGATKPAEREHVTPYFYQHAELFRLASVEANPLLNRPDIRVCVDTHEDLTLIRMIYRELEGKAMCFEEIVRLFERKPEWLKVNAAIQQKRI